MLHVVGDILGDGNIDSTGTITAGNFVGDGSGLTNLPPTGATLWSTNGSNVFYDGGNVGVGTANPTTTLDVAGTVRSTVTVAGTTFEFALLGPGGVDRVQAGYDSGPEIRFLRGVDDNYANVGMKGLSLGSDRGFPTIAPPDLGMIVEGNVGIGTSNPTVQLHVSRGASGVPVDTTQSFMILESSESPRFLDIVTPSTTVGGIRFNVGANSRGSLFYSGANNGFRPDAMVFGAGGLNRMVLLGTGNLGIGTLNPSERLHVVGNILATGSITPGSSRAFKDNIAPLTDREAFDAFAALEPVRFTYKTDTSGDLQLGFIAEDVPELVSIPGRKGIAPMDLIAVLTKVLQQQQERIEGLEERLERLAP